MKRDCQTVGYGKYSKKLLVIELNTHLWSNKNLFEGRIEI